MKDIIDIPKSVIVACDTDFEKYLEIVDNTMDIDKIGGYKIGARLALERGLKASVKIAKHYGRKAVIYDHQKAGNDIPAISADLVELVHDCGADAMIIFPFAGPVTRDAMIDRAQGLNFPLIIGAWMTHPKFLAQDGGYIVGSDAVNIYTDSAGKGIRNFAVPGNNIDAIDTIKQYINLCDIKPVFYAPGLITQGGEISEVGEIAGDRWHAIVGRGICEAKNMRDAALELTKEL